MSTTFHVFPTTSRLPTFGEVLERTRANVAAFLRDYRVLEVPAAATARLRFAPAFDRLDRDAHLDEPFWWPETHSAHFAWGGAGGTHGYATSIESGCGWMGPERSERERTFESAFETARTLDRVWSFRRSADSTGFLSLAYGMLAGSVAELTGGVVHSVDGAWDRTKLPMHPPEFLATYFRPGHTDDAEMAAWARSSIRGLVADVVKSRVEVGG